MPHIVTKVSKQTRSSHADHQRRPAAGRPAQIAHIWCTSQRGCAAIPVGGLTGTTPRTENAVKIVRPLTVPGHIGVPHDEVEIVDGVNTTQQTPQKHQPFRLPFVAAAFGASDQPRDLPRIELFVAAQLAVRVATQSA